MFIRLDIDSNHSICVDHAHIVIEKEVHTVENKPTYYVGLFAITTVANFDDGVVPATVSFHKKSSYRQRIYSREFKSAVDCEKFYTDIITQMNDTIKQTLHMSVDNIDITDRLDNVVNRLNNIVDSNEEITDTFETHTAILEKIAELLTPKEKPAAKSRAKKKDVADAS